MRRSRILGAVVMSLALIALGLSAFGCQKSDTQIPQQVGFETIDSEGDFVFEADAEPAAFDRDDPLVILFSNASSHYRRELPLSLVEEFYPLIGAKAMLDVIEAEPYCHDKAHNIGRIVFLKSQDLATSIQMCQNRCTSGCFHGVLMQFFYNISKKKPQADDHISMEELSPYFSKICNDDFLAKAYGSGVCYHGLGHAAMFLSDYDVNLAMVTCKRLNTKMAAYYCATGAYMEHSLVYNDTTNGASEYYPCDASNDFPAACYRYNLRKQFYNESYESVAKRCLEMNDLSQRRGCFHGYGFMFFRKVYRDPEFILELCSFGDKIEQQLCIEGVSGKIDNFNLSKKWEACAFILDMPLRKACFEARNEDINKDPLLYYSVRDK